MAPTPNSQIDDFGREPQKTGRHERAGMSDLPVRETHLFQAAHAAGKLALRGFFCSLPCDGPFFSPVLYFSIIASQAIIPK